MCTHGFLASSWPPTDAALRNTPELFLHNIDFDTLDVDKDLGLIFDPGNYAYSIERSCT